MPLASSIEKSLKKLKEDNPDVEEVTLVSRSGMHIAGEVPEKAHKETYVAMSAILLGAAETATNELNEELSHVIIELKKSDIMILNGGSNSILAIKVNKDCDISELLETLQEETIREIEELL